MSRPIDPTKRDPLTGEYLSRIKSWSNRRAHSFYLSQDDLKMAKALGKEWKLKSLSLIVREALTRLHKRLK